jgi:hypothetical protein
MSQIIASRPWSGFADLRGMQQLALDVPESPEPRPR